MATKKRVDLCEDRAWLDAFRLGEPAAVERVFRTYIAYVTSLVRAGIVAKDGSRVSFGDSRWAEMKDVVQETFARALAPQGRLQYDGTRLYASFLSGICRNVMLEHLRKRGRFAPTSDEGEPAEAEPISPWAPEDPLPDALASRSELRDAVQAFLAGLEPIERDVVRHRMELALSQRDTANALGITRSQLRNIEASVLSRFRSFLAEKGLRGGS